MDKLAAGRARAGEHWRKTRKMTAILLAVWFGTSFGAVFFARELSALTLFGWPMSFYLAAQGCALIYLAVIAFYAWRMQRLDRQYRRAGNDA